MRIYCCIYRQTLGTQLHYIITLMAPEHQVSTKKGAQGMKGNLCICLFVFLSLCLPLFRSLFFCPSHFLSLSFSFCLFFLSSIHSFFIFLSLFFCQFLISHLSKHAFKDSKRRRQRENTEGEEKMKTREIGQRTGVMHTLLSKEPIQVYSQLHAGSGATKSLKVRSDGRAWRRRNSIV